MATSVAMPSDDSALGSFRLCADCKADFGNSKLNIELLWNRQASFSSNASTNTGATSIRSRPGGPSFTDRHGNNTLADLHTHFSSSDVQPWPENRFELVGHIMEAERNNGNVHLAYDSEQSTMVAVKRMPQDWCTKCHSEFIQKYPDETELPWQDIGCNSYLDSIGFPYVCGLHGVFSDENYLNVVTALATEGDLFSWAAKIDLDAGPKRENYVKPLIQEICRSVQQLHELSIVHRDLSLENLLLSKSDDAGPSSLKLIDFGMASTSRFFINAARGKYSYQAPEYHEDEHYDGLLVDAFAIGVTIYAILVQDYPWMSTQPNGCKCFEYYRRHGWRRYLSRRKLRNTSIPVAQVMSEPMIQLLEGLLQIDPSKRLTLGESSWNRVGDRKSVWDMEWMQDAVGERESNEPCVAASAS